MIILSEVARKIEAILNNKDTEVNSSNGTVVVASNPTDYFFKVETEGFHIDHILKPKEGVNVIPVFVSSMGGQFNPVSVLKQANYTISVAFYFPVKFKEHFFALGDFLADAFVGTILNYGEVSGKAVSNIGIPQFGEIQDLDLKQFQEWAQERFKMPIEIMEPWLSMEMTLYLSSAAPDFVWGNEASSSLSIDGTEYTDDDLVFSQGGVQSNSEPATQQILDEEESDGLPSATSYTSGFSIYVRDTEFYQYLIEKWFQGKIQTLHFTFSFTFLGKTFSRRVYVHSLNLIVQKGQLSTISFTFAKRTNSNLNGSVTIGFTESDFEHVEESPEEFDYVCNVSSSPLSAQVDYSTVEIQNFTVSVEDDVDLTEKTTVTFNQSTHTFDVEINHTNATYNGSVTINYTYSEV